MARITVQAVHANGELRRSTLSERIVAENLASDHYAAQLLERLSWATADAEALELETADGAADHHDDARRIERTISSRADKASPRLASRPIHADRRVKA
jgi:hypothetical protein